MIFLKLINLNNTNQLEEAVLICSRIFTILHLLQLNQLKVRVLILLALHQELVLAQVELE